jgi:cholesterol oxidase
MVRKSAPEQVETVVVGSGFGGSVTAFRLAEAGRDVLVLERGRAYPPGSFPRSPGALTAQFWEPSAGRHGLFDVWSLGGVDAIVAAGLGGGSLIGAGALERADERWFVRAEPPPDGQGDARRARRRDRSAQPHGRGWPVGRAELEPHYDAVERMLGAAPFPAGRPGFAATGRAGALRDAAERAGLEWHAAALAVSFGAGGVTAPGLPLPEAPYGNVHGRARTTCQLAGDCVLGCNHGAKNSLDHTYLSAAAFHGAEIRTRCEVRGITPDGADGWVVSYVEHHRAAEGVPADTIALPMRAVRCARVVLAAGALGSTYLLLRARPALGGLAPMLGHGFSGNGDALGLVIAPRRPAPAPGGLAPTITGAVRVPDTRDGRSGFVVHDAGVPAFVSWLLAARDLAAGGAPGLPGLGLPGVGRSLRLAKDTRDWVAARLRGSPAGDLPARLARLAAAGADAEATVALLAVGRAGGDGVLRLADDRLDLDLDLDRAALGEYFDRVRATMTELAAELGGRFEPAPLGGADRRATAHPLGGAPMGHSPRDGVVDEFGQAFGYPGLYVLDGAALPGPVGAAPALTIAAYADRAAQTMVTVARRRTAPPRPRPAAKAAPVEATSSRPAAKATSASATVPKPAATGTAARATSPRSVTPATSGRAVASKAAAARTARPKRVTTATPRAVTPSTPAPKPAVRPASARATEARAVAKAASSEVGSAGPVPPASTAAARPAARGSAAGAPSARSAAKAAPAKVTAPRPVGTAMPRRATSSEPRAAGAGARAGRRAGVDVPAQQDARGSTPVGAGATRPAAGTSRTAANR